MKRETCHLTRHLLLLHTGTEAVELLSIKGLARWKLTGQMFGSLYSRVDSIYGFSSIRYSGSHTASKSFANVWRAKTQSTKEREKKMYEECLKRKKMPALKFYEPYEHHILMRYT